MSHLHEFVSPLESRQLFAAAPLPVLTGSYSGNGRSLVGTLHFTFDVVSQKKGAVVANLVIDAFKVDTLEVPTFTVPLKAVLSKKGTLKGAKTVSVLTNASSKPLKINFKLSATVPTSTSATPVTVESIGGGGTFKGSILKTKINLPVTFSLTHVENN